VLTQIITALGPLKLVIAGVLFFNLAWLAVRKWLVMGVFGVSVGEVSVPQLWSQVQQFGIDLFYSPARALSGIAPGISSEFAYALMANAMLATAIWFAVRGLRLWARATVKRHEEEFWDMVYRDEQGAGAPVRVPTQQGRRRS